MSLIEKAVERLGQLKRADEASDPEVAPVAPRVERSAPDTNPTVVEKTSHGPLSGPLTSKEVGSDPELVISRHVDVDLARLAALGMVTPDKPRSMLAEQFRVVKRPLIRNAKGKGAAKVEKGNLIMVTSALPREGKSFSAINLAISMAMELDFRVLLVDADFARPSILPKLALEPQKGLMDVLLGDVSELSEVILRTNIEKLSLLPAGMPHPRATELIASEAMANMLEEISGRYPDRIIIFDSPPLIPTTEARVLAAHMGQILVVVEADRTTHGALRQALTTIENCPVKLMLLNKASVRESSGLYGYGYGYGYGEGEGSDRDGSAQAA